MKAIIRTLSLAAIILAVLSNICCKADHVLTIYVDTSKALKQDNIATVCSFSAGQGTLVIENPDVENFFIRASLKDCIKWQGVSYDKRIRIKKIQYKSGPEIFKSKVINGKKKVRAKVLNKTPEVYHQYSLFFTVGDDRTLYEIDPKIMVQ